jgi:2-aminoethylphosphonate-pyruvate transaminase
MGADPWLLTPGPLTTSMSVKTSMLRDLGSRDDEFIAINRRMRQRLLQIAKAEDTHVCVPLQGSGTFAVEAMLGTFLGEGSKALILINGAYGERMERICVKARIAHSAMRWPEDQPVDPEALDSALRADAALTHVVVVHCETTSGILNPLEEIAAVTARHGRRLLIDSMSGFGALPIDAHLVPFDALVSSSNKCLEGVPGMGFVIARREALMACLGNARSLSLDLHDQWISMEKNGQWRFTPPVHVILAMSQALQEHASEGGVAGRGARYRKNCRILVEGMRKLGFETLLPDHLQAPIIVTFLMPADPRFVFANFYDRLRSKGYVIYPGKLTVADSFRIGCVGRVGSEEMTGAVRAIRETMAEMGVKSGAPALIDAH